MMCELGVKLRNYLVKNPTFLGERAGLYMENLLLLKA